MKRYRLILLIQFTFRFFRMRIVQVWNFSDVILTHFFILIFLVVFRVKCISGATRDVLQCLDIELIFFQVFHCSTAPYRASLLSNLNHRFTFPFDMWSIAYDLSQKYHADRLLSLLLVIPINKGPRPLLLDPSPLFLSPSQYCQPNTLLRFSSVFLYLSLLRPNSLPDLRYSIKDSVPPV